MNTPCKFYSFLRATGGNWRNAIFISCDCEVCTHEHEKPCSGFLFTGEQVDPAECSAVLPRRSFESAFSKYIEWHTPDPSNCTLHQLCSAWSCGSAP